MDIQLLIDSVVAAHLDLTLPNEIWMIIFAYLARHEFAHLSLVCRLFHLLARPSFFRDIRLHPSRRKSYGRVLPPVSQLFLESSHLAAHVRHAVVPLPDPTSVAVRNVDLPVVPRSGLPAALLLMTKIESLKIIGMDVSAELITSLILLKSLTDLGMIDCSVQDHGARQALRKARISVKTFSISFVNNTHERYTAMFISAVCTQDLRSLTCFPTTRILQVLHKRLVPNTLQFLAFKRSYQTNVNQDLVRAILISQHNIRHLESVDLLGELPTECLPHLQAVEEPEMPMTDFVPGRPVERVALPSFFKGKSIFPSALSSLLRSSVPLRRFSLHDASELRESLLMDLTDAFPLLEFFQISVGQRVSKAVLEHSLKITLATWLYLKSLIILRGHTIQNLTDENIRHSMSQAMIWEQDSWEWERVTDWGTACPTLRMVTLQSNEWVRLGVKEWRGYDQRAEPERVIVMEATDT